jgi:hypothetical protein
VCHTEVKILAWDDLGAADAPVGASTYGCGEHLMIRITVKQNMWRAFQHGRAAFYGKTSYLFSCTWLDVTCDYRSMCGGRLVTPGLPSMGVHSETSYLAPAPE